MSEREHLLPPRTEGIGALIDVLYDQYRALYGDGNIILVSLMAADGVNESLAGDQKNREAS